MRRDFPSRHIILLTTLSLANLNIADDYAQAPFEVASAGPILSIVDPDPANFGLLSDATFATDSTVLDTLPANDQVIVAGGAQKQIQKEKNDNLPPTWIREEPNGSGTGVRQSHQIRRFQKGDGVDILGIPTKIQMLMICTSWIQKLAKGCSSNRNRDGIATKDFTFFAADLS